MILLFSNVGYFPLSKELCKQQGSSMLLHGGILYSYSVCRWRDWHAEKYSPAFSKVSCISRQIFTKILIFTKMLIMWSLSGHQLKCLAFTKLESSWYWTKFKATLKNTGLRDFLGLKGSIGILDIGVIPTSLLCCSAIGCSLCFLLFRWWLCFPWPCVSSLCQSPLCDEVLYLSLTFWSCCSD